MLLKKYDELVGKVNNIDNSVLVLKANYDMDKSELENKIPDTSGLVKKTDYDTQIAEIEGKVPDFNNLATKTALTTVENKIPSVSSLVKKTDYNTKITEIENTVSGLDSKIRTNKTISMSIENLFKKLQKLDLSYFNGKSHFEEDGAQSYLVFQPINRYFKHIANTLYILSWKSKGLSDETIKSPATSDNSLNSLILIRLYVDDKIRLKFSGSRLKQPKIQYTHGKIVNIYIVYELGASGSNNSDPTLKNCLFGAVTLSKNTDFDKYGYSGYEIGFDRRSNFSFPGGGFGQNVLISGVDMTSSAHIDNKKKDILVLGKGPTQGFEHTLTAEKCIQLILQ